MGRQRGARLSVRVGRELEAELEAMVRREGFTKSAIVRKALKSFLAKQAAANAHEFEWVPAEE